MVSKDPDQDQGHRLNQPFPNSNSTTELPSTHSLPSISSISPPDTYSSTTSAEMASMHGPSYAQSPPGIGQPYSPSVAHPDPNQQPPNQYSQYSYDIQLRYPNPPDSSHPYEQYHPSGPPRVALPPMSAMPMEHEQHANGYSEAPPFTDTTGQVAPPGAKPRVTATLWDDEGTLCFQVDVNGTCVARREDNHMINGTKLLNVVGMTRGRRDGILKSEKQKHVVKIGPMHLKGVWIPFDRALEFANKEKITEALYPLFVHNIGALLYHPTHHLPASRSLPGPQEQNQAAYYGDSQLEPGRSAY